MEIGVDQVRATAGLVLLQLRKRVPPPGWKRRPASLERRVAVYTSLQRSASEAMVVLGKAASLDPVYRGWANWRFLSHALRTGDELVSALKQLLGALVEIRMHGNTEPRAAAERIVAKITDLAEVLPSGSRSERARRQERFDRHAGDLGAGHRCCCAPCRAQPDPRHGHPRRNRGARAAQHNRQVTALPRAVVVWLAGGSAQPLASNTLSR